MVLGRFGFHFASVCQERISKGPQGEHEEGFQEWLRQRDQQEMVSWLPPGASLSVRVD